MSKEKGNGRFEPKINGRRVIDALSNSSEPMTTSEIRKAIETECKQSGMQKFMEKLESAGVVEKIVIKGKNTLPVNTWKLLPGYENKLSNVPMWEKRETC